MPSQSRKPHTQSTARLTAAHHRPRTEAKTSHSQAHPHQTSSARSPFPMRVHISTIPTEHTYLPTYRYRTSNSKQGRRKERDGGATLPSTTTQQSSGVLWRAASFMLYSFVSVGIPSPRGSPLYRSNRIGVGKEAAIRLSIYEGAASAAACRGRRER